MRKVYFHYYTRKTFQGNPKYVSCVTSAEPSEEYPSGLILAGCQEILSCVPLKN